MKFRQLPGDTLILVVVAVRGRRLDGSLGLKAPFREMAPVRFAAKCGGRADIPKSRGMGR
jgi:hypothetical protein